MQVLTSLSGLPFSAVSAGFAPTNSADVSAIASAYQVVSSTGTQLYAGSSYLTSVNDAPISASRAGQAANASLSNSAYYDGTGRLISALPDSAAVSAIASSYAESAASGKQDTLEFGYDDGKISSIDGSALAGQGGGGGLVTSIESAIDPWFRTAISGLNGSALYSQWAESSRLAGYATDALSASTAHYAQSAPTAWASSFITGVASPSGTIRVLDGTAIEGTNSAMLPSTVIPGFESASSINADSWSPGTSIGPGVSVTGTIPSENPYTNLVLKMGFGELTVSVTGDNGETASVSKLGPDEYVTAQLPNATSYTLTTDGWVTLYAITASAATQVIGGGVGELAWASALPTYEYDGSGKISAIDGSALAGGGGGGVDSATVSAIASAYVESGVSAYQPLSGMSAYESSFSAGDGLEFVQSGDERVLQVEAPVDIVAGPGIVIDNPDGNTLRVSVDQDYEKELYVNTTVPYTDVNDVFTLSEPVTNFERIRVESWNREFQDYQATYEFTIAGSTTSTVFVMSMDSSSSTYDIQRMNMRFSYNSDGNLVDKGHILFFGNGSSSTDGNQRGLGIHRVVGIHRIANN